ncbi:DNAH6 [Symbiodinium natans]|uniref:DNAH6 protein n=1 Tax=Symbiodinium natans TaxID=878477 RepID=A0A812I890_9DINO|nr:DNAH6 [Symbiodinium natans]
MSSAKVPLLKASSDLDFVAGEDLLNVLNGPVPSYVKTLFEAIVKCTRPESSTETWQQIQYLLKGDKSFIAKLQMFEPEASDMHRIRDILHSELEVTSLPTEFMALFSPACVLLLRWCHALGDVCGCTSSFLPVAQGNLLAAQAMAQEARDERAKKDNEEAGARAARAARGARGAGGAAREAERQTSQASASAEVSQERGCFLKLKSLLSGEVFATLEGALPTWTYKDILDRFIPLLPPEAGAITLLSSDLEPMERYHATLQSLGLDCVEECELHYKVDSALASFRSSERPVDQADRDNVQIELDHRVRATLEQAQEEMNCLDKRSIVEVRAMARPPVVVCLIMEAVAIIQQQPVGSWREMSSMLGKPDFLDKLRMLDVDTVPPSVWSRLEWYVNHERLAPEVRTLWDIIKYDYIGYHFLNADIIADKIGTICEGFQHVHADSADCHHLREELKIPPWLHALSLLAPVFGLLGFVVLTLRLWSFVELNRSVAQGTNEDVRVEAREREALPWKLAPRLEWVVIILGTPLIFIVAWH